jgi:hypothetical protein
MSDVTPTTANRTLPRRRSTELRAWHAVGVLSAPPRSLKQTEISRLGVNSPEPCSFCLLSSWHWREEGG